MIDLIEIYVRWYAGRSQVQIAESLGVDRKTVRKYWAPVTAEGLVPGGPPVMSEADWRSRAVGWFPGVVDQGLRQVTWPAIEAHRDYISAQLKTQVTVSTIHQRLVDEHQLVASVASVRRWVAGNLPEEARRAAVRVLRPGPVPPGSEAQIDYGRLGVWTDPATGRRQAHGAGVRDGPGVFPVHVRAPGAADGPGGLDPLPRRGIRLSSTGFLRAWSRTTSRTGVDKPDLYDPKINRSYAELATHYGVLVDPARAFKPKDKPRVERPMPYVRDSFWRGRTFTSLEAMQAEAVRWAKGRGRGPGLPGP